MSPGPFPFISPLSITFRITPDTVRSSAEA